MRITESLSVWLFAAILPGLCALLSSCASPNRVSYFQDLQEGTAERILNPVQITVRPKDKISIIVKSKDPLLADLFNLPIVAHRVGQSQSASLSQSQQVSGYTVDAAGDIDFPVLGKIHVAGMNRERIAAYGKNELVSGNLVKDPVVTVEFMNLSVAVMGEVNRPGRFAIERDRISILEAISMAGDLTVYGKRENVLVLREVNGRQAAYRLNLCSGYDLYASPAYYLRQNDVVYVEPNVTKARQSTVNGNNIRSTSFWISLASLLTSVGILIFR
jgi:polysaccharide export outer membrane protein